MRNLTKLYSSDFPSLFYQLVLTKLRKTDDVVLSLKFFGPMFFFFSQLRKSERPNSRLLKNTFKSLSDQPLVFAEVVEGFQGEQWFRHWGCSTGERPAGLLQAGWRVGCPKRGGCPKKNFDFHVFVRTAGAKGSREATQMFSNGERPAFCCCCCKLQSWKIGGKIVEKPFCWNMDIAMSRNWSKLSFGNKSCFFLLFLVKYFIFGNSGKVQT